MRAPPRPSSTSRDASAARVGGGSCPLPSRMTFPYACRRARWPRIVHRVIWSGCRLRPVPSSSIWGSCPAVGSPWRSPNCL
eukprot:8114572-Pyramimonas_sp.AAC.1